jgi:hypothetical protein
MDDTTAPQAQTTLPPSPFQEELGVVQNSRGALVLARINGAPRETYLQFHSDPYCVTLIVRLTREELGQLEEIVLKRLVELDSGEQPAAG